MRSRTPARRRRTLRAVLLDAAAVAGIGAVIVGAALVPALTASTEAATTVDGDVREGADVVAGMPIGFWSPTQGVLATTTSDDAGRFVLPVPTGVDGYVYAGTTPDALRAITDAAGRSLVRAVIGARPNPGVTSPLYQGFAAATARNIAGGGTLHFALQRPGRLSGTSPLLLGSSAARLELQRLDGSVVQELKPDRRGRFATEEVVPGDYRLQVIPKAPLVPATLPVTVPPGATARVTLPEPRRGATLRGDLTVDGRPVPSGVPVLLVQGGKQVAATTTDDEGAYAVEGVAAGTYDLVFGRHPAAPDAPSPLAGLPADEVQPATARVAVATELTDVVTDAALTPAGVIDGRVTGAEGVPATVLAEDPSTRAVLRSAPVDEATGAFRLGGLAPGATIDVIAVTSPDNPALALYGTTTATADGGAAPVIAVTEPGLTLSGTIPGAASGTVTVGDATGFTRTAAVDPSGAYAVAGLVPGAFPTVVRETGRIDSDPVPVTLTASATQDLPRGPAPATYRAWFISGGAGVPRIVGTATDGTGRRIRFGPLTEEGRVAIPGLAPGTYRYDGTTFGGSVAALDGPWWFGPPTGTFTLRAGSTTDVGPVVLRIRAH